MLLLAVMLSACAPPKKISLTAPNEHQWQQHQQQVSAINRWNISGRMAIETEDNGGQVDIFWQQTQNDTYDIRMIAPFGGGTSLLTSRPEGVVFTSSNGEQIVEKNADRLMARVEGWTFPVSGLRYWILGVPEPEKHFRLINWNEQGYVNLMEQDGWRIEMLNYRQVAAYTLPKKIFISRLDRDDLSVRMVIREWGFTE